jgi:hypothetical protein
MFPDESFIDVMLHLQEEQAELWRERYAGKVTKFSIKGQ